MIELPTRVRELLEEGQAVLVAGSGTTPAVRPRWTAAIEALAAHLADPGQRRKVLLLLEQERAGAALAILRDRLGVAEARRVLAQTAESPAEVPAVLQQLAGEPWRAILTTDIDDGWSRACVATGDDPILLAAGVPVEGASGSGRALVQVLGRASQPETLCLGPADLRANVADTGLGELLAEMGRALTLVFVGFRASDPDLEWLADQIFGGQLGEKHLYLCADERSVEAELVHARWGMTAVAAPWEAGGPPPADLWRHLHEELETHLEAGRWGDAVPVLERLAGVEEETSEQVICLQSAGLICRDKLGDDRGAYRFLGAALERLGPAGEPPLRARLWDAVGRLAWKSLADPQTALAALGAAQALAPSDEREAVMAAVALDAGPAATDQAVTLQQRLAARAPDDPRAYRALERLWTQSGQAERWLWAAAALAALDRESSTQAEQELPDVTPFAGLWEQVRHPDEEPRVSAACAKLAPDLIARHARPPETLAGADRPPPEWAAEHGAFPERVVAHAARALVLPAPALARGADLPEPASLHAVERGGQVGPVILIDARWAAEAPRPELAFALARAVALSRPAWFLRFALPAAALAEQLRDKGLGDVDLPRWAAACELSAARAALLVTGDLTAAARVLRAGPPSAAVLPADERLKDLLAFAVSEDHFELRCALGLDAASPPPPPEKDARDVDAR